MKLKMQKWDPLTGQSKAFSTQMTVKACGPLVMHKRQVILAILYIKLYRCANSFLFDQNLAIISESQIWRYIAPQHGCIKTFLRGSCILLKSFHKHTLK